MPEHPKGGRRHAGALTFRGLLMWGGDPPVHGLIVPVLLSDYSRGRHVGAPHNCLQSLHKARAESPLHGRNTLAGSLKDTWGHLAGGVGLPLPVNRGTHSPAPRWPGAPGALGAPLGISSHLTDREKRPSNP